MSGKYILEMKKRTILIIMTLAAVLCLILAGCGEKEEEDVILDPSADEPGVTDEEWAAEVWNEAVGKLFETGYAEKDETDGIIFRFRENGEIDLHGEGSSLESSDFRIDDKMIWGSADARRAETVDFSVDTYTIPEGHDESEKDEDTPEYLSSYAFVPTPIELFAKSRGRCRYLVLVTGLIYNIVPDYYRGPVPRRDTSTCVFVIDAVKREVVHIHHISNDVPGSITKSTFGEIFYDGARNYMNKISQEEEE